MAPTIVCFLLGTQIETPDGERKIESLKIGDRVTTVSGKSHAIKWIGRMGFRRSGDNWPEHVLPIRIAQNAFGEGTPARDLFVSPNHALYIDGALVCAKHLVNGDTIAVHPADDTDVLLYFHIELAHHDVVMANGVPAETLRADSAKREIFSNFAEFERLYPGEGLTRPRSFAPVLKPQAATTLASRLLRRPTLAAIRERLGA
jgi:hypothetical protein